MQPRARRSSNPAVALGHRSGLEDRLAETLDGTGYLYEYETVCIPYVKRPATYTPDFFLLNNGILIESKGYFLAEDRTKHILVQAQHPHLDIRFVFARAKNPISPGSRTTYSGWCDKHKFLWADSNIPVEWLAEPRLEARWTAAMALRKTPK